MKTDSLNLPGYPEASQDAAFVTSGTGQATRFFKALGEKLSRREWEAEHPEVAIEEPKNWRYLFERPSVRSKTEGFREMVTRFNAKDVGFGRENDTLLVLPPEETDKICREILKKNRKKSKSRQLSGCTEMSRVKLGGDYVRPGTMTILSDRWEGVERENVMRHELAHQFAITLRQMIENENERRRVQGLSHLSKDELDIYKCWLTDIDDALDLEEKTINNGNLMVQGHLDIIEELQRVERDFWKKLKNQEEKR